VFVPEEDKEDVDTINMRVVRGGTFDDRASIIRSSYRNTAVPAYRSVSLGFRPARTYR
jgi:formylglycine-generating enzyme required for sulfatase activity